MKTRNVLIGGFIFSILLMSGCGGGGDEGGSSTPLLQGNYVGIAGSSTPIEFSWSQSGTSITGTAIYDESTHNFTGTLSGNQLDGEAEYDNGVQCRTLFIRDSTVNTLRTIVTGTLTVRSQRCDGTGGTSGGTSSFTVEKEPE